MAAEEKESERGRRVKEKEGRNLRKKRKQEEGK